MVNVSKLASCGHTPWSKVKKQKQPYSIQCLVTVTVTTNTEKMSCNLALKHFSYSPDRRRERMNIFPYCDIDIKAGGKKRSQHEMRGRM